MPESRLARRSVKQSKKSLYYSLGGIVVVLILAFNFGPMLLDGVGSFIDKITGNSGQQEVVKSTADLIPPTIDFLPVATPSARINVTGTTSYPRGEVELYVNGSLADKTEVDSSQEFEFKGVRLSDGNNSLKARMILNDKRSEFSDPVNISFTKSAPKLEISSPSDKQSFSKADQQIVVRGTTDSDNNVSVNGFVAIVDSSGNFTYDLKLNDGDNKITVVATNQAGQATTKELTVSYSP